MSTSMFSRRMGLMGLAAAAALAIGGSSAAAASASSNKAVQVTERRRYDTRRGIFDDGDFGSHKIGRRAGYGWTNRHQQRVAKKKRNQARHRRACRG